MSGRSVGSSLHLLHTNFMTCLQLCMQPSSKKAFTSFLPETKKKKKSISAQNFKEGDIGIK